jgi:dTDP-4-amino-4,6-dideoxygalactose transaminase
VKVPFLDLKAQYESIRDDIGAALQEVIDNTAFAGGPFVERFENEFASFCQCEYAVGVSSGTSALWTALRAVGVSNGDEVITTPSTFIATAEAISLCGATPRFVDVDDDTYNMAPDLIEACLTPRVKAIVPVHLFGQPVDMDPIMEIARTHHLFVIEDACQAHGAQYKGRPVGSIGHAGCFSFYPGKNLGAYGEAGAVVTNDSELAQKIRMFREHGQTKKYYHHVIGWNDRMDGIQGAVLSAKLKHLNEWNDKRRKHARLYNQLLRDVKGVKTPIEADYARHVYHIYAIRTKNRDALMKLLGEKGIQCGIHYPVPIHLQDAYEFLGYTQGDFPVAETCANEFISLPMYAELSPEQIEKVCSEIRSFFGISPEVAEKDALVCLPGEPG